MLDGEPESVFSGGEPRRRAVRRRRRRRPSFVIGGVHTHGNARTGVHAHTHTCTCRRMLRARSHTRACMHAHTRTGMHAHTQACTCTHTHGHACAHTHSNARAHTHRHAHTHTRTGMHAHTRTGMHAHTHTHTHSEMSLILFAGGAVSAELEFLSHLREQTGVDLTAMNSDVTSDRRRVPKSDSWLRSANKQNKRRSNQTNGSRRITAAASP